MKEGKSLWKVHRDPPGGFTIRGDAQPRVAHGAVFAAFADGTVSVQDPGPIPIGKHKYRARQTVNGLVSGNSDELEAKILAIPTPPRKLHKPDLQASSDTGPSA